MTYRITRTVIRGQFANDSCFAIWLAANAPNGVYAIKSVEDSLNNGGPNDKRLYLWQHTMAVATPKCAGSDPDLVVHNGLNGWESQADAQAVLDYELGQSNVLAQNIAAQNAAATDPANIAAGVAKDVGKAAENAANAVKTSPWFWLGLAAAGVGVVVAIKVLK